MAVMKNATIRTMIKMVQNCVQKLENVTKT